MTVEVEVSGAVNRDDDRGDEATFRYRVLLVEDEQFTRGLLTQTLTGAGIDVLA